MVSPQPQQFGWHTFDVRGMLPAAWEHELHALAEERALDRELVPASVTSREDPSVGAVQVLIVEGGAIASAVPWLQELYLTRFRELAELAFGERVSAADEVRYAINLNVQRGASMRYECHVDSNPIGALLYVTTHPPGAGGELVVSNTGDVSGTAAVDADCTRIYPVAGHLVLFDARAHSHYVAPLLSLDGQRIVVAMNYYTPSCPERERPADLSQHLFGINHDHEEQPA